MRYGLLATLTCLLLSGETGVVTAQTLCPTADGWEMEVLAHLQSCPGELSPDGRVCSLLTPGASILWQSINRCTGWILTTSSAADYVSVARYFDVCVGNALLAQSDITTASVSDLCRR
jgi:hypothetical protein